VECNQKSLAPTWELVQLDVFDKLGVHKAMLEIEKKHNMAQREGLLLMGLLLVTTLLCLVKVGMENNFGYCFVTNQSIW
jgi:hypothetical protein